MPRRWPRCWSKARGSGSTSATSNCSTATSAGAALDTFMVSLATDSLTRIYGIPGKTASRVRRFGMGLINRIGPVKDRLMAEARGTSGDLPLLLRGLPI